MDLYGWFLWTINTYTSLDITYYMIPKRDEKREQRIIKRCIKLLKYYNITNVNVVFDGRLKHMSYYNQLSRKIVLNSTWLYANTQTMFWTRVVLHEIAHVIHWDEYIWLQPSQFHNNMFKEIFFSIGGTGCGNETQDGDFKNLYNVYKCNKCGYKWYSPTKFIDKEHPHISDTCDGMVIHIGSKILSTGSVDSKMKLKTISTGNQ